MERILEQLGFCDCGFPEELLDYIFFNLNKINNQEADKNPHDVPFLFFCQWANKENYAEHGNNIRLSWLTTKGEYLLNELRAL